MPKTPSASAKAALKAAKTARIDLLANCLRAAVSRVDPTLVVTAKPMFGGAGFYVGGKMMAAWYGGGLALKLGEADRRALLSDHGGQQAQSPQYIELPEAWLDDMDMLADWAARALRYSLG